MNIGTRVKVNISNKKQWTFGAADYLNGKTGVVEDESGLVLVRFDTPAEPWHSYQAPVVRFHFHRSELIDMSESPMNGGGHNI